MMLIGLPEKDIDQEIAEHKKRIQECDEESSHLAQLINQDLQPAIQELQNQIENVARICKIQRVSRESLRKSKNI